MPQSSSSSSVLVCLYTLLTIYNVQSANIDSLARSLSPSNFPLYRCAAEVLH
jgi:hypothetical protein